MAAGIVVPSMVGSDQAAVLVYAHPLDHSGRDRRIGPGVIAEHPLFDVAVELVRRRAWPGIVRMSNHTATFQSG